jgi:diguanylate cyclase (GGDEF)-like protein/PAS domain S-box-containing protein
MISTLQLLDCLSPHMLKVMPIQKYQDVIGQCETKPDVFVVLDDEENFLDLVEEKRAALSPGRIFSDLLVRGAAQIISPDATLDIVLKHLDSGKNKFMAVVDNHKFVGVVSHLSFFTALIQQEKEIRQERDALIKKLETEHNFQKLATLVFENTAEGILITDAGARIIQVNRGFSKTTGYEAEEVIGKNPNILHSGLQNKNFYQVMWQSLQETGAWEGEVWNQRKNGEIYPEWLHINTVRDDAGKVVNYVGVFSDMGPNKKLQQDLHQLAYYDPLTNLPNRRLLVDRVQQAIVASTRNRHHCALLFIDLDNFKTLNDTQGHDIGDLLLIEIARRLQNCVRAGDMVTRLGGDEFVVMLEGLSSEAKRAASEVEAMAEKILSTIYQPHFLNNHEYHGSGSIGISLFCGNETPHDVLLKHADTAMYQSKQSGRNTLRFFDPAMQIELESRVSMEADLRRALSQQQFKLYYQMQIDHHQRILGAEILLRWEHPLRGLVSPAQFIPLAEESGLILQIGYYVLETTCLQLKAWEKNPHANKLLIAVNISARQFRQTNFVEQIRSVLAQTGANPQYLKLELTETVVLDNMADTVKKMQALQALGVSFSVDDFGTGYSSLAYLKRLPLNQLKIDQSFVQDITTDTNDAIIVKTIIVMAKTLGLDVIAEGVETEAQLELLQQYDCHAYQGYLFGKPVPIEEFELLLNP